MRPARHGVPEGAGMGFVAGDHGIEPTRAAGGETAFGLEDEGLTDAAAPAFWDDGEAIDAAAPAVPAGDDGADETAVFLADEQGVGMLANDPLEVRERVGGPRDGLGAFPQLEHLGALL